jgi:hypothetical protein
MFFAGVFAAAGDGVLLGAGDAGGDSVRCFSLK